MPKIAAFIVMAVVLIALLFLSQQKSGPLVVSGIVEADEIRVGSRVGGRVLKVLVEEGTAVCAGATLVELEPFDLLERKAEAQQLLAQAAVDVRSEEHALLQEGSRIEDIARAEAQLEEAEQELKMRQHGYRTEEIAEAKARRDAFDAAVRAIERQISELRISAPSESVVEAIELQPGDLLSANAPAVALVDRRRMWVRAYVPENHLNLTPHQAVNVRIDSFPGRIFKGEIVFVARQAEFTPANVQTPEERSKQVFRIKVQLTDDLDVLRPGMAADVILSEPSAK